MLKIILCFVIMIESFQSIMGFPNNLTPINTYDDVPTRVFTGKASENPHQTLYVQLFKTLTIGHAKRIAIAGRENLFLLDPGQVQNLNADKSFNYTEAYSWESGKETKELCRMKGQSQEQCHNYLSVLEKASDEQLLICGTNSYNPACRKYEVTVSNNKVVLEYDGEEMTGRLRSSYGPSMPTANLYSGGSLYSATYESFFGGHSVVSRTLGQTPTLRSNRDSPMNEPDFVKITEDDERILIFFNENELLSTGEKRTIPQVAQVCKNDRGGDRILEGLFTTFIKSGLNCSYNGFYFNQISDLTSPILINGEFVIFATFATPENSLAGSAMCSFSLPAVRHAMTGPFRTNSKVTSKAANTPPAPERHPGLCSGQKHTDEELLFIKSNLQMENQVAGSLLLTNQGNRWTSVYAHHLSQPTNVTYILIGTENGRLIRSLPPAKDWPKGLIISDTDVFDKERCSPLQQKSDRRVKKILVENDNIFIAFKHCVVTVPLKWCAIHRCESMCMGAADPFCGWNGTACTPLGYPRRIEKANLPSDLRKPCPIETQIDKPNLKNKNLTKRLMTRKNEMLSKSRSNSASQLPAAAPVQLDREPETFSYQTLIIVAICASLATIVLAVFIIVLCCCCCKRRKQSKGEETLKEKQSAELHSMAISDAEKRSSLTRFAQKTYKNCKDFVSKATTPIHSPEPVSRNEKRRERRENEYSEAPNRRASQSDREGMTRKSKSRMDSTSTASSRQDTITRNSATRPLLSTSEIDETLPREIANAATLLHSPQRNNQYASSPARSSETSFVAPDEPRDVRDGTSSSNSAIMRRKEHARQQTNDIMRESGSAIRGIESALLHMEEQGMIDPQDALRQRTESDDSGKGESPRNSCQAEIEKADAANNAKMQRPKSLNVAKRPQNQRTRLMSEGSHPYSDHSQLMFVQPSTRERHHSGQTPMQSLPGTPVNVQQRLSLSQANRFFPADFGYGTAPRSECPSSHGYIQQPQYEKVVPAHIFPTSPTVAYVPQQQVYMQRPPRVQRQISEPQSRAQVGRSYSTSMKYPPNYYPSLQEKNPAMPVYQPQEQPKRAEPIGPINHYPSLPHRSSTAPYGDNNTYVAENGFERPATLHKREKMPSMMRQSSTPAATRNGVYVPPPTIPKNGIM